MKRTSRLRERVGIVIVAFVCLTQSLCWGQVEPQAVRPQAPAAKARRQVRRPPDVTRHPCREALTLLRAAGWYGECVAPYSAQDPVTHQDDPAPTPEGPPVVRLHFDVAVPQVVDVAVPQMSGDPVSVAEEKLRNAGLVVAGVKQVTPDGGTPVSVVGSDPPAGTRVAPGSGVTLLVAPDRLAVEVNSSSVRVMEAVTVTARLEPSRPEAMYTFDWGDETPSTTSTDSVATHPYRKEKEYYTITVKATDSGGGNGVQGTAKVQVLRYNVILGVYPPRPRAGESVTLTAQLEPAPPPSTEDIRYNFSLNGAPLLEEAGPEVTGVYRAAGAYKPAVMVTIGGVEVAYKDTNVTVGTSESTQDHKRRLPGWSWPAVGIAAAAFTGLVLRYGIRKRRVRRLRRQITVLVKADNGEQKLAPPPAAQPSPAVLVRAFPALKTQTVKIATPRGKP